jgi:hypothetical protein
MVLVKSLKVIRGQAMYLVKQFRKFIAVIILIFQLVVQLLDLHRPMLTILTIEVWIIAIPMCSLAV